MTTSFLNLGELERAAEPKPSQQEKAQVLEVEAPQAENIQQEDEDFEIVFGRRQIASTGLVLMVVLAFFSGVSYLIGKSSAFKSPAPAPAQPGTAAAPQTVPPQPASAVPSTDQDLSMIQAPLFGQEIVGQTYLQEGVIDKAVAALWAEGLRVHGLNAFVAPGPNDTLGRVLIGPLPNPQDYHAAKATLDRLGVTAFGRVYQPSPTPPVTAPSARPPS